MFSLESTELDEWTIKWVKNWLSTISGSQRNWQLLTGSVLRRHHQGWSRSSSSLTMWKGDSAHPRQACWTPSSWGEQWVHWGAWPPSRRLPVSWRGGLTETSCSSARANAELCVCGGITHTTPLWAGPSWLGSGRAEEATGAWQIHDERDSAMQTGSNETEPSWGWC